jgi:hypothetical protein
MSAEPVRTSGGDPTPSAPFALLLYGEEYANLGLADELALDGYEVRRASDPAMLRAACDTGEIEVVIFASQHAAGRASTCCASYAREPSPPRSSPCSARSG